MGSVSIDALGSEIQKALDEYSKSANDVIDKAARKVSNDTVKTLKSTSPQNTGRYAKSWTKKQTSSGFSEGTGFTVYSRKPGLPHLLEHGHAKYINGRCVGTTPAKPHIASAEQQAITDFENQIRKGLSRA